MSLEEKLAPLRIAYAANAASLFDELMQGEICESPIERLMLAAFLADGASLSANPWFDRWREMRAHPGGPEFDWHNFLAVIGTQVWIETRSGSFRADFAILSVEAPPIIVECDGHEFHEKTKEQVERDKRRERALTTAGWRVLRFSGSEIWRDPVACVRAVNEAIVSLWGVG